MGKRAASRLVMVSGMSEEFCGAKERTGVGQPLLRVPTCAQVNRHNKRGSVAALRGAGQPLAPVIPRAGAVSQAEPEAEKSKPCIWHSKGRHNLWLFSSWSREKEKNLCPLRWRCSSLPQPRGEPGPLAAHAPTACPSVRTIWPSPAMTFLSHHLFIPHLTLGTLLILKSPRFINPFCLLRHLDTR